MANGKGTVVIDFGASPGSNEASVVVSAAGISAASVVDTFIMADDTSVDHTASDHRYLSVLAGFTCGTPTTGSFTLYATSIHKLTGKYTVHYVWAD